MRKGRNLLGGKSSRSAAQSHFEPSNSAPRHLIARSRAEVRKASQNLSFVLTDKTLGVHNVACTDQLLNHSEKTLREALSQASSQARPAK